CLGISEALAERSPFPARHDGFHESRLLAPCDEGFTELGAWSPRGSWNSILPDIGIEPPSGRCRDHSRARKLVRRPIAEFSEVTPSAGTVGHVRCSFCSLRDSV